MKQLQLEVEAQLFNQGECSLVEMIEILGIEGDVAGKTIMQKIKIIRKGIDNKMESDEKVARTCLEQLLATSNGLYLLWNQRVNRLTKRNKMQELLE